VGCLDVSGMAGEMVMRFSFGKNWENYLKKFTQEDVESAKGHLKKLLDITDLDGKTFLDVGSGSGLSSLVAKELGADVISFDYDSESVKCTKQLAEKYSEIQWPVKQGSVLDETYMESLGKFDIVYSWGVLHHTGDLYKAMHNVLLPLKNKSILYIALYNDQGWISQYWLCVKYLYNKNLLLKYLVILIHTPYHYFARFLYRKVIKRQRIERGMRLWFDMLDWLGGYPFEVIKPERVIEFYGNRGLELKKSILCGKKHGCNEFVFER